MNKETQKLSDLAKVLTPWFWLQNSLMNIGLELNAPRINKNSKEKTLKGGLKR